MNNGCIRVLICSLAALCLAMGLTSCRADRRGAAEKISTPPETHGATAEAKVVKPSDEELIKENKPSSEPTSVDPPPLLPDSFKDIWVKDGPVLRFTGADLYGHINGGAEVFLELGFENLVVQRYKRTDESPGCVDVEIYWMTDPDAAIGVYLLHFGREERLPKFAPRHTANRYQVQYFMGNAYVKVNNPKAVAAAGHALPDFARHVARQLPAQETFIPDDRPDIFESLPAKDRIEGSERIIRGPFTLERIFLLGPGDMLQLSEKVTAHAADYNDANDETYSRVAAIYSGNGEARAAFDHFCENLDANIEPLHRDDETLIFKDYSNRFGSLELQDNRIDLIVNKASNPLEG